MKIFFLIMTLVSCLLTACNEQGNLPHQSFTFTDTGKSFKREIPVHKNGKVSIFYSLAKARQKQLGLDSLENGFDNLEIKVWYDVARFRERKLVVITNKGADWTANIYHFQTDWDEDTKTTILQDAKHIAPKSGWDYFSKRLLNLKVLTLPNMDDVPGYGLGEDGDTYNVEVATKMQYRFYSYWEPQTYQDEFWQAKNMADILKLFEQELGK